MKMTSAEANKLLHKLNDERDALLNMDAQNRTFTAATVENVEEARPEYSYEETNQRLIALDEQIRRIKHALNSFNLTQVLPGLGITIDQALIYIPQLNSRKRRLAVMRSIPKKQRSMSGGASLIEYTYANYDVDKAEADYTAVTDELFKLQNTLDLVNSTVQLDIEL